MPTISLWTQSKPAGYVAREDRTLVSALFAPDTRTGRATTPRTGILMGDGPNGSSQYWDGFAFIPQDDAGSGAYGPGAVNPPSSNARNVRVSQYQAVVGGQITANAGVQHGYLHTETDDLIIPIDPNGATDSRIDVIATVIADAAEAGGTTSGATIVIKGTPSANPVAPAQPTNTSWNPLATVRVRPGATTFTKQDITDLRQFTAVRGAPIPVRDDADLATLGYPHWGMLAFHIGHRQLLVWDGQGWATISTGYNGNLGVANTLTAKNIVVEGGSVATPMITADSVVLPNGVKVENIIGVGGMRPLPDPNIRPDAITPGIYINNLGLFGGYGSTVMLVLQGDVALQFWVNYGVGNSNDANWCGAACRTWNASAAGAWGSWRRLSVLPLGGGPNQTFGI